MTMSVKTVSVKTVSVKTVSVKRAGRAVLTPIMLGGVIFASVQLAATSAMAQLSTNKGGRETVPGGVEAKPGVELESNIPKSTAPPVGAPAPGLPPRTRGLTGGSPAPSTTPAPMPSKIAPTMPDSPQSNADKAKADAAKLQAKAALPGAKPELKALASSAASSAAAAQKAADGFAALQKSGQASSTSGQGFANDARTQAAAAAAAAKKADEVK